MTTSFRIARTILKGGSALPTLALLGAGIVATPAFAQDAAPQNQPSTTVTGAQQLNNGQAKPDTPTDQVTPTDAATADGGAGGDIVVTGSLFRRANTETPSPVTLLTQEAIQQRGLTTVSDAIRSISSDSSGSVPAAFSGGFAGGASGVSLRGLGVNNTLTVFDGIRAANYPLGDDGERSFVDLNTIPEAIVDRIEVLKDGASSTYGADAVAGVVNIITKKEIRGLIGRVEGGISERGDGEHQRASLTAGYGDLAEKGWNVYVSGEYEHDGAISTQDRGFPYNTRNLSSIGGRDRNPGATGPGNTGVAVVQPATYTTPGSIFSSAAVPGSLYQPLGGSCGALITHTDSRGTFCEDDRAYKYGQLQPDLRRYGVTAHLTVNVGDNAQAYAIGTYYENRTTAQGAPSSIQGGTPIDSTLIALPALLSNGQLNPNNPFAASGQAARLFYTFDDIPSTTVYTNRTYRGAAGISGKFGDGWGYSFDATAMKSSLDIDQSGYINIPALVTAINTGSYNFINPSANTAAVRSALSPEVRNTATSELYLAQGTISKSLFQLPGGPLQVAIGGAVRHEKLNDPNQNADGNTLGLNSFTAIGSFTTEAAYFEIDAPVLDKLEINGSGRFDHYSQGFSHFSPKIGAKFTPVKQIAFRGTYSEGFRAPSIPETSGAVIGYAGAPPLPDAVVNAHNNNAYVQPYNIGYNTAGTPGLKPEKSRSFTGGIILQPTSWFSFTADYYNIKKTDYIVAGPNASDAIAAYYANPANPVFPAGYSVTLNPADQEYPNAIRTIKFVNSPYVNAGSYKTSGIDLQAQANVPVTGSLRYIGNIEVTEVFEAKLTGTDGQVQSYVGTEGPYQVSAGAGTPRWRGNWQNTLVYDKLSLTATAYYTSGYKETSDDTTGAGTAQDCANDLYARPAFCHVHSFITTDLVGSYKVNDNFTFYVNVINLLDAHAPLNPANYASGLSGANYNPAYAQSGVVGRFFRAGASFKF